MGERGDRNVFLGLILKGEKAGGAAGLCGYQAESVRTG